MHLIMMDLGYKAGFRLRYCSMERSNHQFPLSDNPVCSCIGNVSKVANRCNGYSILNEGLRKATGPWRWHLVILIQYILKNKWRVHSSSSHFRFQRLLPLRDSHLQLGSYFGVSCLRSPCIVSKSVNQSHHPARLSSTTHPNGIKGS